ncbi:hypothetical protein ACQCVO_21630 [Bacillus infantis]|uniref:hypothetical protein n=1 Tax=Bacillus infantis TaxID=324767 RepID=UPI003CF6F584
MNQFEKEFGLSSKFPTHKLKENKLKQIISEASEAAEPDLKQRQNKWRLRTTTTLAYAATLLLTFSLIFGYLSYERASLFKDQKIENDISVSIEKVRILIDKNRSNTSGVNSPNEVNELLSRYFSSYALAEMVDAVALLKDKDIKSEEAYNKLIAGKPVEITMTNIIKADGISVEKLSNQEIAVLWFDKILNKSVSVKCKIEDKKWIITHISI